jgi:hypothetical protein
VLCVIQVLRQRACHGALLSSQGLLLACQQTTSLMFLTRQAMNVVEFWQFPRHCQLSSGLICDPKKEWNPSNVCCLSTHTGW